MSKDRSLLHQPTPLTPFEDILDELEQLSREHLLFYRVQVGNVFLRHFWADDVALYQTHNPHKTSQFSAFFLQYQDELKRYGLSKSQAQRSIRASIVVRTLPPAVAQRLFVGQVLELARLRDPTQRVTVAVTAIDEDWSVSQLRDAISLLRAGLPLDQSPEIPGMQLGSPPPNTPKPVPGRLVTRAEKLANEVHEWTAAWTQVDPSRLRRPQRLRLKAAVTALEEQVAALRATLAAGEIKAKD